MRHLSSFDLTSTLWKKWKSQLLALPPIFPSLSCFVLIVIFHCHLPSRGSSLFTCSWFCMFSLPLGSCSTYPISPSCTFFTLSFFIVIGSFTSIFKNIQVYFTLKKLPSIFIPLQSNLLPFFLPQYKNSLQYQTYIHFLSSFILLHPIYSPNPYSLASHNDHQH